jgi:hypothetical protein
MCSRATTAGPVARGEAGPELVAGWHFDESFDESHPLRFEEAREGAQPGDLFWMREGTYTGDFVLTRSGTPDRPIIYRVRPGHRATIEGNLTVMADHVWVWGLELTDPNHAGPAESLLGLFGSGVHAINNVISEGFDKSGIGAWNFGPGQVVYGNLIYRTGRGPTNPHGIYTQNNFDDNGYKYIVQNMLLDAELVGPRRYNLHAYAECGNCGPRISGLWIRGNVLRNGPALIGGFNEPVTDCVVEENYSYRTEFQIGFRRPTQLVMTSNMLARSTLRTEFFWGDGEIVFLDRKPNVFRGNSLILPTEGEPHLRLRTSANLPGGRCDGCPPLSPIDEFDDNHYSAPFRGAFTALDTNYGTLGFSSWTNLTQLAGNAFDSHSRVDAIPAGVQVVLQPNDYEPGRAHLVILNWDLEPAIELDLSAVVALGDYFRIHDATNFFGNPLRSGTYQGPVRLPTGRPGIPRSRRHLRAQGGGHRRRRPARQLGNLLRLRSTSLQRHPWRHRPRWPERVRGICRGHGPELRGLRSAARPPHPPARPGHVAPADRGRDVPPRGVLRIARAQRLALAGGLDGRWADAGGRGRRHWRIPAPVLSRERHAPPLHGRNQRAATPVRTEIPDRVRAPLRRAAVRSRHRHELDHDHIPAG